MTILSFFLSLSLGPHPNLQISQAIPQIIPHPSHLDKAEEEKIQHGKQAKIIGSASILSVEQRPMN